MLPDTSQFGIITALYQRFPNEDLRRLLERAAYHAARASTNPPPPAQPPPQP